MPISLTKEQAARLEANLSRAATTDLPSPAKKKATPKRDTTARQAAHSARKPPIAIGVWVQGTYQGRTHLYNRVDQYRFITACMMESHRPNWQPNGLSDMPPCEMCLKFTREEQSSGWSGRTDPNY